jgi:hypothetical protein
MTSLTWRPRRLSGSLSVLLLAGATTAMSTAGIGTAAASAASTAPRATPATCTQWTAANPVSLADAPTAIAGVAVLSTTDAWAVGTYHGGEEPLTEQWNGSSWSVVPVQGATLGDALDTVSALSPTDAWAAGWAIGATTPGLPTYIVHWNGSTWSQVASPSPSGGTNIVSGIDTVSANDAWAVGYYSGVSSQESALILHWNGSQWSQVPSPNPAWRNMLYSVTATSSDNAWAVGTTGDLPLILHWNGSTWQQAAAPQPGQGDYDLLTGVTATSAQNAWAVGNEVTPTAEPTLILHWNGTTWSQVASPNPGVTSPDDSDTLVGVVATSATNAWAAGNETDGDTGANQSLILQWTGTAWVPVANPGGSDNLTSIAASASDNAWIAGDGGGSGVSEGDYAEALHC